jgi:hypothetical protein
MSEQEQVACSPQDSNAWICQCGNMPESDGFYPCHRDGSEVEPDRSWSGFYVCNRCRRIIDGQTRYIVGRRAKA